ncbi:MAG: hypothetical protein H6819_06845 [Phycisphaerales bacterium]|nr:hypothetical protein [Phycisphaerales bacterium]MCB9855298.1 hypothetical protein [Phycisphaerales bacterium]MCB9862891.1 hypothetical protein [Phycisphaerales bacterium]
MPTNAPNEPDCSHAPYRSWGELQIAAALTRHSIPFDYEQPVAVVDNGQTRIWYPDFSLRGLGIYVEYCGRPNDPAYQQSIERKQRVYQANGMTTLMLSPGFLRGDAPDRIRDEIRATLVERIATFDEHNR